MLHITLPPAIAKERDLLVAQALDWLRTQGYNTFRVHDYPESTAPEPIIIPVLNTSVMPDIAAQDRAGNQLLGSIEVSTDISDSICGRRWQALHAWAEANDADYRVFVQDRYREQARQIAAMWHLAETLLVPLRSPH